MFGPGVNILRTPLCGRNFEYLGEDPFLAAQMCVGYKVDAVRRESIEVNGLALEQSDYAKSGCI